MRSYKRIRDKISARHRPGIPHQAHVAHGLRHCRPAATKGLVERGGTGQQVDLALDRAEFGREQLLPRVGDLQIAGITALVARVGLVSINDQAPLLPLQAAQPVARLQPVGQRSVDVGQR